MNNPITQGIRLVEAFRALTEAFRDSGLRQPLRLEVASAEEVDQINHLLTNYHGRAWAPDATTRINGVEIVVKGGDEVTE
jgi:hypothetical protein